jgi:hypothetical protein
MFFKYGYFRPRYLNKVCFKSSNNKVPYAEGKGKDRLDVEPWIAKYMETNPPTIQRETFHMTFIILVVLWSLHTVCDQL